MPEISRSELYQKTRDDILRRQLSNNENFDRSILTLSSAGLALSVAFLQGETSHSCFPMLVVAWAGFVAAVISTLISYLVSQKGLSRQLGLAEQYYLEENESARTGANPAAYWTDRCAYISATTFVFAIDLLLAYFAINAPLRKENVQVSEKRPTSSRPSSDVRKGASVPRIQRAEGGATVPPIQEIKTQDRGASVPQLQPAPSTAPVAQTPQEASPPPSTDSTQEKD